MQSQFGLVPPDRVGFGSFTLIYLSNPEKDFELELAVNKGSTKSYELRGGYGHFAVVIGNIEFEHKRIEAAGVVRPLSCAEEKAARACAHDQRGADRAYSNLKVRGRKWREWRFSE